MNPLVLTLDIGTSSSRALLWDTNGQQILDVKAQRPYQMQTTPDGGVEMPAEELFGYVADCLDEVLHEAGTLASAIQGVGISTFWHSLLGIDAAGTPLTPVYSWADTRAAAAARQLRSELDTRAVARRTGCWIHPSYYPAKLLWLQTTQPEIFARVARWISPSEYLMHRLFGPSACNVSLSMASGTGLLNQTSLTWDAEMLAEIGLPLEKLSPIVDLNAPAAGLKKEFAERWPALQKVPFYPAVGDGACGNIGSGCASPDKLAINMGTSGAIRGLWQGDIVLDGQPEGLWRYRADSRRSLIGAAFSDAGNVYQWLTHTFQLPPLAELETQLEAMKPGEHGLQFLPFLAGERSLGWNPDSRATLTGLNLDSSPVEIVRACMEGITMRFALAADRLKTVFPQAQEFVASGGVLGKSPVWAQMFADALGHPVTLAEEAEASSRGAALLAMEAGGLIPDITAVPARMGITYSPNPKRQERYQQMLAEQQGLYHQLIENQKG